MIKNERQYRITRAQAGRLRKVLSAANNPELGESEEAAKAAALGVVRETRAHYGTVHPLIAKAQEDAINSQLADLEGELTEYETLKSGGFNWDSFRTLADIPKMLIQARIAKGLSQRELAETAGAEGAADPALRGDGIRFCEFDAHSGSGGGLSGGGGGRLARVLAAL